MKTADSRLKTCRRGWVVWAWSKLGSLLVFTAMMLMLLITFSYISAGGQADAANQLSRSLRNVLLDTYNSGSDMAFEYELPASLNGEGYSVEVLDKDGMAGIITRPRAGIWEMTGGSSTVVPLSSASFGELKGYDGELRYICIVKGGGEIDIERQRC